MLMRLGSKPNPTRRRPGRHNLTQVHKYGFTGFSSSLKKSSVGSFPAFVWKGWFTFPSSSMLETFLYLPPKFVSTCKQVGLFAQVVTCLLITLLQDQQLCQIHIGGQGIVRAGFDLCHVVNLHLEHARHVSSICLRLGDPLLNCGQLLRRRILGLLVLQLLRLSLPRGSQCLHMLRHIRGTLLEGGLKLRQGSEQHATPDQALLLSLGRVVPAPHTQHLLDPFAAIAQNSLLRSFSIVDSLANRQHSCRGLEELAIRKTARFQATPSSH